MSVIDSYPNLRPSLLMDFANSRRVDPRLQCTRASTATCYGPDGRLRTVAANVPRIDFDPVTGRCLGLLVEEARTNLLLQSVNMADTGVWVSSSGQTCTPAEAGAPLPFKVSTAQAVTGGGWTNSMTIPAGSTTLAVDCARGDQDKARIGVTFGTNFSWIEVDFISKSAKIGASVVEIPITEFGVIPTLGGVRAWITFTSPGGVGAFRVYAGGTSGVNAGFTYYGFPQVESGVRPTSYIPTTNTQATRALDSLVIPATICADLFGTGFTLLQQLSTQAPIPAAGSLRHLGASVYANGNNRVRLYANSGNGGRIAFSGRLAGVTDTFAVSTATGLGTTIPPMRGAFALSPSGLGRACVNGGAVVDSTPQLGSLSGIAPAIYLGTLTGDFNAAEQAMNGYMQRLAIYPAVLSDAQLQRLTA